MNTNTYQKVDLFYGFVLFFFLWKLEAGFSMLSHHFDSRISATKSKHLTHFMNDQLCHLSIKLFLTLLAAT